MAVKMWRFYFVTLLIICCETSLCRADIVESLLIPSDLAYKLKVIDYTSRIFCNSRVKVVNIHFENETPLSYPGHILKELNDCGISYISLRNKFFTRRVEILKDDGIIMYLIMVLRDISQGVKLNFLKKRSASKHLTFIFLIIEDSSSHQLYLQTAMGDEHNVTMRDIFPTHMLNMRGKPLRMCMYEDSIRSVFDKDKKLTGSDGLMSGYLAQRLNATRVIDWMKLYDNASISRDICFKEIVDDIDDVAVNIRFLSMETFYKRVEYTIVHSRDDLCVMVPKAKIASSFFNLFHSFNSRVWFTIFVTLLFGCGFCIFCYGELCMNSKFLLELYGCIISIPFLKIPLPNPLRIFLCTWLLFGMLISVAFKGNLTGNLVDSEYLPDLNTIPDFARSPYCLAVLPRHIKHINNYLDAKKQYEAMLKQKVVETPDFQFKYLKDSNNLSYAYLQKYHISLYDINSRKHSRNGQPLYHVMRECLVPFHAIYIVPYGSPYLGFINTLLRNAQEFGFIIYWDRLMNAALRRSRKSITRQRRNEDEEPVVLTLAHYQAVFSFLFVGLALSLLCFLIELLILKNYGRTWKDFRDF